MFRDRAMVFDQAPIVLPAAECAAHWYLASSEHDEIACLSAELRFQVAASRRAGELYAGLYAHRDTPPLARRSVRSALLSVETKLISPTKKNRFEGTICHMTVDMLGQLFSVVQPSQRSHLALRARPAARDFPPQALSSQVTHR